jgi:hypothetical protein
MHIGAVIRIANIGIELCQKFFLLSNASRIPFYPSNDLVGGYRGRARLQNVIGFLSYLRFEGYGEQERVVE